MGSLGRAKPMRRCLPCCSSPLGLAPAHPGYLGSTKSLDWEHNLQRDLVERKKKKKKKGWADLKKPGVNKLVGERK